MSLFDDCGSSSDRAFARFGLAGVLGDGDSNAGADSINYVVGSGDTPAGVTYRADLDEVSPYVDVVAPGVRIAAQVERAREARQQPYDPANPIIAVAPGETLPLPPLSPYQPPSTSGGYGPGAQGTMGPGTFYSDEPATATPAPAGSGGALLALGGVAALGLLLLRRGR